MAPTSEAQTSVAQQAAFLAASMLAPHISSIENALGGLPVKQRQRLTYAMRMNNTFDVRAQILAASEGDAEIELELERLMNGELGFAVKDLLRDTSTFVEGLSSRIWAKRSTRVLKQMCEEMVLMPGAVPAGSMFGRLDSDSKVVALRKGVEELAVSA